MRSGSWITVSLDLARPCTVLLVRLFFVLTNARQNSNAMTICRRFFSRFRASKPWPVYCHIHKQFSECAVKLRRGRKRLRVPTASIPFPSACPSRVHGPAVTSEPQELQYGTSCLVRCAEAYHPLPITALLPRHALRGDVIHAR